MGRFGRWMARRRDDADERVLGSIRFMRRNVSGFEIMRLTKLSPGRIYPALDRLEAAGLIYHYEEQLEPWQKKVRPPRRLYAPTGGQQ